MLFAVVALVASTQVASAQIRGGFIAGNGFAAGGVQAPGFVAGGTQTPFQATRGFAAASPAGFANGAAVATPLGSVGAVNAVGPFRATAAQGFTGQFVNGGQFQTVGPAGVGVTGGQLNGFGRTLQGTTITGPGGRSLQAGQIVGPNGTLNTVRGPNGNTLIFRSR